MMLFEHVLKYIGPVWKSLGFLSQLFIGCPNKWLAEEAQG
jgi:hypothetical protein